MSVSVNCQSAFHTDVLPALLMAPSCERLVKDLHGGGSEGGEKEGLG